MKTEDFMSMLLLAEMFKDAAMKLEKYFLKQLSNIPMFTERHKTEQAKWSTVLK